MSKRKIIECDRCGAIDSDNAVDRSAWAQIYAATLSGTDVVGTMETPADLCGDCGDALKSWMTPPATDEGVVR